MGCQFDIEKVREKASQLSSFLKKDVIIYLKGCGYKYCSADLNKNEEIIETISYVQINESDTNL